MQGLTIKQDPYDDEGKGRVTVRPSGTDRVKPFPSQLTRNPAVVNNRPQGQIIVIPHSLSTSPEEHLKLSRDKGAPESLLKLREGVEANLQFLQTTRNREVQLHSGSQLQVTLAVVGEIQMQSV